MSIQKPKGTQDLLPGVVEKWQYIELTARTMCQRFNYREIRTAIFEHTELYQRGVGETTDIVEKEMYTFIDKGERSISLRPEGTAGVVRAYVENKLYGEPDVSKLYYIGPMFRYEQPQAGRYRQFHQFGVEAFGATDPSIDAEIIGLGYRYLQEIGISDVTIQLNSVGTIPVRAAYRQQLQHFFAPIKSQLCKDCQSRFDRNPMRILDCKVDERHGIGAPSILDHLDEDCNAHFTAVQKHLHAMKIPFYINPRMVRGLDYYTHTAFEYKASGIGAIDTIGGGGRYNGLVAQIGGDDQPGIGFGIGLERVLLILEQRAIALPEPKRLDLYLIGLGAEAEKRIVGLLHDFRMAGLVADKDYLSRKMKAQMKSADRFQAQCVGILGDEELSRNEITIKQMSDGSQTTHDLQTVVEDMVNRLHHKKSL